MIIKTVNLKNFRNYNILNLEFDPDINIIYGDNAQGKTNILEALYVCATSKSHRGNKDNEMISFNHDEGHIKVVVKKNNINNRIDMHLKKNKAKGIAVNGIPIKKAVELFGILNIIFFSPEDLNIINSGPSERRRFIDMELSQLDKIYLNNLINYNKVVNQRNKLLKETNINDNEELLAMLDIWDIQLIKYGSSVIKLRNDFINQLNKIVCEVHKRLSGNKENLVIKYEPSVSIDGFEKSIHDTRYRDIKLKSTGCGPHKDDIVFYINGKDVKKYGSQGQKRTVALSLKMAEIELVKSIIKDSPILLLDDVLSELDSNRQNFLLDSINGIQTIITCTGIDDFISRRFKVNKIFNVIDGKVINEN